VTELTKRHSVFLDHYAMLVDAIQTCVGIDVNLKYVVLIRSATTVTSIRVVFDVLVLLLYHYAMLVDAIQTCVGTDVNLKYVVQRHVTPFVLFLVVVVFIVKVHTATLCDVIISF
jgi:hypothetical protein